MAFGKYHKYKKGTRKMLMRNEGINIRARSAGINANVPTRGKIISADTSGYEPRNQTLRPRLGANGHGIRNQFLRTDI
jgi:hypothetical protein